MFYTPVQKRITAAILIFASLAVSGCATPARSIDSGEELAKAGMTSGDSLVFGKLEMQRNGETVKISNGLFGYSPTLYLIRESTGERISGAVGAAGEFAWALAPGEYTVSKVSFMNRGEKFEPEIDYRFAVVPGSDTVYIGTITLESTFESGYYGLNGTVDSYSVDDHCESDCADRLARLGLSASETTVALLTPLRQSHFAD